MAQTSFQKVTTTTLEGAKAFIKAKQPFKASAMTGSITKQSVDGTIVWEYEVKSYGTTIARWSLQNGWEYNTRNYSRSTSRHQNLALDAIQSQTEYHLTRRDF
jgi:hypothetical protein